jgi:hypothetical protein
MAKINLNLKIVCVLALGFIISGCTTSSTNYPHIPETTLSWFAHGSKNKFEDTAVKEEYKKKIDKYLELNPQTNKDIADKMRNCRVALGMTEEQVLTMAKPNQILEGWNKNKKVFKYSDVSKFGWSRFIGEGIKVRVTFINGVVTDISELDTIIGP